MPTSELLDKNLCDKLVQSASLTIGHDILITDESGFVVASNDADRVGSLHEASLEVIQNARSIYHDHTAARKLAGTRPGITIPISIDAVVIGTIGITGAPHEISQYALLIQQLAQIFLNFQKRQMTVTQNQHQKLNLLRKIITYTTRTQDEAGICEDAYELGLDLSVPRAVVLLQKASDDQNAEEKPSPRRRQITDILTRHFPYQQDFVCAQSDSEFIVLAFATRETGRQCLDSITQKCHQLAAELLTNGLRVQIAIGSLAHSLETLRLSYENARLALRIIQSGIRKTFCLSISDALLERLAAGLPDELCEEVQATQFPAIQQAKNYEEIMLTIEQWYRHQFNFVQTAQALHIHKSTLVYRFRRIQETCGLDLYDLDKVIAIYLMIIRGRLDGRKP